VKIAIENDRLVVRKGRRVKFSASADEVTELRFLAEHTYYGPKLIVMLVEWLKGYKLFLRAAIVWTADKGITLDSYKDKGLDDALVWFDAMGWDVSEGKKKAFEAPLVRQTVPRK
jgi:hypothetical protein